MTGALMLYRPASVQRLLLVVLSVIVFSLILVLIAAKGALDRLAMRSWQAVVETVRIVESGRMLMGEVTEIERSARQFQSLGDANLYEIYLKQREPLKKSMDRLAHRNLHPLQRTQLNHPVAEVHRLYETLHTARSCRSPPGLCAVRLVSSHRSVVSGSGKTIGREAEHIRGGAAYVQHLLFWQAAAVIPALLVIPVVGPHLIARPPARAEPCWRSRTRGRSVPSGHIKGTGLGLAITREFVRAHEGSIEVVATDRGARLQATLPLEETPAEGRISAA